MRPLGGAGLFGAESPDGAEPVSHVEGFGDSAVLDGLNIDRHDPKALAGVRHAEQVAGRRTGDLPRTMTRSPATSTSLMSNFMSGMVFEKFETTLIDVSRPQHSPGR